MTTLLLLRHSIPERGGSSPDPGLSAEGLQRAAAVFQNDAFRTVSLVWSSPSLRALQTAQLLGLPVRQDTRLAERRTGDTTGQDASFWKRQYEDPDFKNPDGESFREVSARMADCIHELLDSLPEGQNALVVSHAAAICSYLQRFCTVEVTDAAQKLRRITFQGEVLLDGHFWEADGLYCTSKIAALFSSAPSLPQKGTSLSRCLLLAEMVGFEPTCPIKDKTISSRSRYDHFDTSPYS